jgi:hypothetical protein
MLIHPFAAGVLATLFIEMAFILIYAYITYRGGKR